MAVLLAVAALPLHAQQNSPDSSANTSGSTAGTTVNNQTNLQINSTTFFGFGPGVSCPTPSLALGLFGGRGSGRSLADPLGAAQGSSSVGGVLSVTVPIGTTDAKICETIGERQVQTLLSQAASIQAETAKTGADINLAIALQCLEIKRQASLTGAFANFCSAVSLREAAAAASQALQEPQGPLLMQRFDP